MYPILFLCCLRSCNTNSENNISPAFPFNELNRAAGKSGGQTVRKEGREGGVLARCMLCGQFMAGKSIIQIAKSTVGVRSTLRSPSLRVYALGWPFLIY